MNAGTQQSARLRPFRPVPFGRYTLLSPLATGGMGEIFLARFEGSAGFEKLCVIKKILSALAQDPVFVERFVGEARTLVKLSHGSIAQVFDMGLHQGEPYIALEFVDGKDLRKVAARQRDRSIPLPLTFVLFVMSRVLDALAYAHRKRDDNDKEINLVHRDISPQNILISYEGEVKVIDFGLAKSALSSAKTNPSMILGKFLYMSPEQARHQKVDRRSDLYSVGVCLYEMISGRNPFDGVAPGEIMARVANPVFPSLQEVDPLCPQAVVDVVMRALQIDPSRRFQSAEEMRGKLLAALLEIDPTAGPESVSRYMRDAFANEHAAERKLLASLNQAKPVPAAEALKPKGSEVETAVVHLKDVAPSVAAAMNLSTHPAEPQRSNKPTGPIEPAPLSFAPTPRAREAGNERPEGETMPGVSLDEATRPAAVVVTEVPTAEAPIPQTADWEAPDSVFDQVPKAPLPPPTLFEKTSPGVDVPAGDGVSGTNPGLPPTIEISPDATADIPLPDSLKATDSTPALSIDTQPRSAMSAVFEETVPRVVLGTLIEDTNPGEVAKEDTQPRARVVSPEPQSPMVGRRETLDEVEAQPTSSPTVVPVLTPKSRPAKQGMSTAMLALLGFAVFALFVGGALFVLPMVAGPEALPFSVPWAPKKEEVVTPPQPRPLAPIVEVKKEALPPPAEEAKLDAGAKAAGDEEIDLAGLTPDEPEKKFIGPIDVPQKTVKKTAKKPLSKKGKQLQSEFRALSANFEFVRNRMPCETPSMGLICTKYSNLKNEVEDAESESEIEQTLKRVRDVAQRVADQKKKLR